MPGLNKVMLIGNLGRDPEIRRTQAGDPIASFSIATSEAWTDKNSGERKERTEWHNIVIFNENLSKVAEQYLKKGSKVYVEGQLASREYTDKDGNQRKVTEIVLQRFRGEIHLLDRAERPAPDSTDYGRTTTRQSQPARSSGNNGGARPMSEQIDDDIPF